LGYVMLCLRYVAKRSLCVTWISHLGGEARGAVGAPGIDTRKEYPMRIISLLRGPALGLAMCGTLLVGCTDVTEPAADQPSPTLAVAEAPGGQQGAQPLTIMTRNLYHGGDISPMLGVDFSDHEAVVNAAAPIWAEILANDFHERVVAVVDEIEEHRPDVVGFQELAQFLVLDRDMFTGVFTPIGLIDFQTIIEDELSARGLPYSFVVTQANTTVEVPVEGVNVGVFIPTIFVRLTVSDGVLVRRGLKVRNVSKGQYEATMQVGPIHFKRGWIMVDAKANGVPYHFVNTHLEIQPFAPIQALQTQELLDITADLEGITVLMGDFNSNAAGSEGDPSWTATHDDIVAAGFDDAWSMVNPDETPEGLTCCQASDLRNATTEFYQRIDFIFLRAVGQRGNHGVLPGFLDVELVGEEQGDRTYPNGLWPSDHAGVVADLWWAPGQFKKHNR